MKKYFISIKVILHFGYMALQKKKRFDLGKYIINNKHNEMHLHLALGNWNKTTNYQQLNAKY